MARLAASTRETRQLLDWMRQERIAGTRFDAKPPEVTDGDMGAVSDVIQMFLPGGVMAGTAGAVAGALWNFIQARRAKVQVTIKQGNTETVVKSTMSQAKVQDLVEQILAREAGSTEPPA
ncbi:effector-associated constant component EACC1 [Nocardioides taihuensis]|uniref:DUF1269 domain-containing protein n=1 Tax=Nocardioides taihuensis TaxID=1835606 RepID=A0ABW0BKP8_9ACTN